MNGTENASSVEIAPRLWTRSSLAMVQTRMFIAKLAMANVGDHTVMGLLADLVSCKLMDLREFFIGKFCLCQTVNLNSFFWVS